jgi:hypothetical protein
MTYDCDIDRVLARIDADLPRQNDDVCTVVAAFPADNPKYAEHLPEIKSGKMPRFVHIPAVVHAPARILDFSTLQTVDMRALVRIAGQDNGRLISVTAHGQLRLLELLAHAIGDMYRRQRPGGIDDGELFARVYRKLSAAT